MNRLFILILASIFLSNYSYTQSFEWANMAGGEGSDQAYAMATDNQGNSYVTGWFTESASFGDIILTSEGGKDVFIAKYNNIGEIIWAKRAWGNSSNTAAGITIDWDGFPIITGWFAESIHFGDHILNSNGSYDMFVVRFNGEGDVIWAKSAGGEGDDYGNRLTTNLEYDVLVSGSFRYTALFGEETSISSEGNRDIFIANYSNNGNFQWVKKAGGEGEDRAYDILTNDDGTYFTGLFNGTAYFGDISLNCTSFLSTYIAKMDAAGNFIWVREGSGGANDFARGYGLGLDGEGYVYGNGSFSGSLSFGDTKVLATGGEYDFDAYLVKYNSEGVLSWLRNSGGYGNDQAMDLFTDFNGNSFVVGFFSNTALFGDFTLESTGLSDIFIAQYNWAGNVEWVKKAGGNYLDYGYGISGGNPENSNLYFCGNFQEEASFGDNNISGMGEMDMFISKLNYSGEFINNSNPRILSVSPNPSNGSFEINLGHNYPNVSVNIFTIDGKLIMEKQFKNTEKKIEFNTKLSSGAYNISVPELNLHNKLIIK